MSNNAAAAARTISLTFSFMEAATPTYRCHNQAGDEKQSHDSTPVTARHTVDVGARREIKRSRMMAAPFSQQAPISSVDGGHSARSIDQAGALCWRINPKTGLTEVLLVASLRTGQWGIPKGHIEHGETASSAAVREAFEEAGAIGSATARPLGQYRYSKGDSQTVFRVTVHLVNVASTVEDYPEKHRRPSRWVSAASVYSQIAHPTLRRLLLQFFARSVQT